MAAEDEYGRRAHPRAPLPLKVTYRSTGSFLVSYSLNLSKGGLFLESDAPQPVGTTLTLKLQVPGAQEEVVVTGRVAWVRDESQTGKPTGMGIAFGPLEERVDGLIDGLIRDFAGITILLVGGASGRSRTQLTRRLRSLITCHVVEVENPQEAIEAVEQGFDLVVVDLDRTGEDVLALMELLTTCRENRTPVVALAANESKRRQASSLGADQVIDTRGPPSDLKATVLKTLAKPELA